MKAPHVVMVSQNALLELDMRPRREAEALAAAGYGVTLVGGCRAPERVRQLTAPDVNLELYSQPSGGIGVSGQIREQSQATVRAGTAVRRAARRAPVAAVHAGNPPDNFFPARRLLRPLQGFTPRFVFDQHDAAPLLLREKFPRTPFGRPLMAGARAIERRSFAAAGLVVFANEGYHARALREGLLYDMLGRLQDEDARERSIRAMQRRYHVDLEQAARVEATANILLKQVTRGWQLIEQRYRQLLAWAARLHEVGLDIAHARYHHHGGYLIANSDLPGFVRLEQQSLATLVALHRRKLDDPFLDALPGSLRGPTLKLVVLLRLATLLNRSRSPSELPPIRLAPGKESLELQFPPGWLDANPLTAADLQQEETWLKARGFELELK